MTDHYIISVEPVDDEVTPLLDDNGLMTRQGYNGVNQLEKLGYLVKIEKVENA